MNTIYYVVLALFTASSLINHIKWSRIAQREHYVPSYVTKIYFRWVRLVPYNGLLFFVSIVLFFSSFVKLLRSHSVGYSAIRFFWASWRFWLCIFFKSSASLRLKMFNCFLVNTFSFSASSSSLDINIAFWLDG